MSANPNNNDAAWPSPGDRSPQGARPARDFRFLWVPLLAVPLGLLIGAVDVHRAAAADLLSAGAAAALGFLHPKTCWLSAVILTGGLYAVHMAAIAHGVGPPYAEADAAGAGEGCFTSGLGCLLCAVIGGGVGLFERAG